MNKFGKHIINLFYCDQNYINLNNGSYGTVPVEIREKMRNTQDIIDLNIEKVNKYQLNDMINLSRAAVAQYVNADKDDIVIIPNASDGINSILRSLMTNSGEVILIFDISYRTTKNLCKYLENKHKIILAEFILDEHILNSSDEELLNQIEHFIKSFDYKIKLACIDHILSTPAVILPVKKIIALLNKYSILSFVDGAHCLGHIHIDLSDINPHFYISNFYKWFYCPRACSFLYARKDVQKLLSPAIISVEYNQGFATDYSYSGARDYTPYFTIEYALSFRKKLGELEIMNYISDLAWLAGQKVAELWKTEVLIARRDRVCAMVNVRIPSFDIKLIEHAQKKLMFDFKCYFPVFKFSNGNYYARLSAQIYNEISDYIYAAENFLYILNNEEYIKIKAKF